MTNTAIKTGRRIAAPIAVGILMLATTMGALVPTVGAHNGGGCGLSGTAAAPRLEGECYSSPEPCNVFGCTLPCDPDPDGEHTYVRFVPAASGSQVAFTPHAQCGFIYNTINFRPASALPGVTYNYRWTGVTLDCSGFVGTEELDLFIWVDSLLYSAVLSCDPAWGLQHWQFTNSPVFSGTHRVDVVLDGGAWTGNADLDFLDLSCTGSLLGFIVSC